MVPEPCVLRASGFGLRLHTSTGYRARCAAAVRPGGLHNTLSINISSTCPYRYTTFHIHDYPTPIIFHSTYIMAILDMHNEVINISDEIGLFAVRYCF